MKIRTLMLLTAVIALLFGLGYVVAPAALLSVFGASTDAVGLMMARFFGGAIAGNAVLTWFARGTEITELRRHIVPALAIEFIIGTMLALVAQLMGIMQASGWIAVVILGVFAIAWGYVFITTGQTRNNS